MSPKNLRVMFGSLRSVCGVLFSSCVSLSSMGCIDSAFCLTLCGLYFLFEYVFDIVYCVCYCVYCVGYCLYCF